MTLDTSLLHYFVRDALGPYSEDFKVLDRHNPTILRLNEGSYSVHVSYVHDSGNSRGNANEVRIQIGRSLIEKQRTQANKGIRVAFIGFFEGGRAFVAWDPRHIFSLEAKTVVSVYARQSQLADVEENQASVHKFYAQFLNESSQAIALPASALGLYLENVENFHRLRTENSIRQLLRTHTTTFEDYGLGSRGEFGVEEGGQREKFTFERKAYPRDPRFKNRVLGAYGKMCCICNRQLGLVQAAHIIPHSEPDSPNTIENGLAMCIEHHRLYDDALLLPGPGQKLIFNKERAEYLRQTEQGRGLDGIEELSGKAYTVPSKPELRPRDAYLERGISIRFGN